MDATRCYRLGAETSLFDEGEGFQYVLARGCLSQLDGYDNQYT